MPLLKVYERVLEQFKARLRDDEVMVRFMRIPVPDYDEPAFREAFVNALVHRDYTPRGSSHPMGAGLYCGKQPRRVCRRCYTQ